MNRAGQTLMRDGALIIDLVALVGQAVLVIAIAPLLLGLTRMVRARVLRSQGPPPWQSYRDVWKLLHKETLQPSGPWIAAVAPYAVFAAAWIAAMLVPGFAARLAWPGVVDLLLVVLLLFVARLTLIIASLRSGISAGGIQLTKEMRVAAFAEPTLLFSLVALALIAGTTRFDAIALQGTARSFGEWASFGLAIAGLMLVVIAENARCPLDQLSALARGHDAIARDYWSRHLALLEMATALRLVVYLSLLIAVIAPVGIADDVTSPIAIVVGIVAYALKLVLLAVILPLVSFTSPWINIAGRPVVLALTFALAALAVSLALIA